MRDVFDAVEHTLAEHRLACLDVLEADRLDVLDSGFQRHRAGGVDRTGFELVRQFRKGHAVIADRRDHLAARQERRHGLQVLLLAVQDADAHGRQHLVAGEDEEVDVEVLDVHRHVGHALGAVTDDVRSVVMAQFRERFDVVLPAHDVRDLGDGEDLGFRSQCLLHHLDRDFTGPVHFEVFHRGAGLFRGHPPGQHVAVMLQDGNQDLIALFQHHRCEAVGDEVQALGSVAGKDDLLRALRVDEVLHGLAAVFIGTRRALGQLIDAPERVRVGVHIELPFRVHDALRVLRGRGVVEVREVGGGEEREVGPHFVYIDHNMLLLSTVRAIYRLLLNSTSSSTVFSSGICRMVASSLALAIIS